MSNFDFFILGAFVGIALIIFCAVVSVDCAHKFPKWGPPANGFQIRICEKCGLFQRRKVD